MQIDVKPGKYILAVSGGVDSMVLLDVLSKMSGITLVVAHFEHGIRDDSDEDRKLVEAAAAKYNMRFIFERGGLGEGTSEAIAREKRYAFLWRVREQEGAAAIITAHHQDDAIETAIINMMRGTGRKGLSSLQSSNGLLRPLLYIPKETIIEYAETNGIVWREDGTNSDDVYLRNYIRHEIMPRLGNEGRRRLLEHIKRAASANPDIDQLLLQDVRMHLSGQGLDRRWFVMLPYDVSCEVMATWLRSSGIREFDRKLIARLVVAAKVAMPGKSVDVNAGYQLKVAKTTLQLFRSATS